MNKSQLKGKSSHPFMQGQIVRGKTFGRKTAVLLIGACVLILLWVLNVSVVSNSQIQLVVYILDFYLVARFVMSK